MKTLLTAGLLIATAFAAEGYKVLNKIKIGGTGGWDYVTADGANHRLYVSHGTSVAIVDTDRGTVVGTVASRPMRRPSRTARSIIGRSICSMGVSIMGRACSTARMSL